MELFLIRHATAVPRSPDIDDAARSLTSRGRKRWHRAVRGLERLGVRFDRVYHSPWLRAVETASALKPLIDGECIVTSRLAEPPSPGLLEDVAGQRVALVGHEPWMSALCSWLLVGSPEQGSRFVFKKGGVARLEGELRWGGMRLVALLPPRVLRALR